MTMGYSKNPFGRSRKSSGLGKLFSSMASSAIKASVKASQDAKKQRIVDEKARAREESLRNRELQKALKEEELVKKKELEISYLLNGYVKKTLQFFSKYISSGVIDDETIRLINNAASKGEKYIFIPYNKIDELKNKEKELKKSLGKSENNRRLNIANYTIENKLLNSKKWNSWTDEDQRELDELREYRAQQGAILSKVADTNNKGIKLEKEGDVDAAIKAYEENIALKQPALHAYWRLIKLYRKRRDYENELRIINIAIKIFMEENERRANLALEDHPEWRDIIMQAMETNEEVRLDDGQYVLNQYNVIEFIDRAEKVKNIINRKQIQS